MPPAGIGMHAIDGDDYSLDIHRNERMVIPHT